MHETKDSLKKPLLQNMQKIFNMPKVFYEKVLFYLLVNSNRITSVES